VDVSQLDELYTLVQELITNRLRLNQAVDGLDGLIGDLDREGLTDSSLNPGSYSHKRLMRSTNSKPLRPGFKRQ